MKMYNGTFGSHEQYKMLDYLTEKIALMDNKQKKYISSLIQDINDITKKSNSITDKKFKNYTLDLIHNDYSNRINKYIGERYDVNIFSYLMNYLNAKIKNAKIE